MEDRLRTYVDELFAETTPSKKAVELKEEMIQNLHDKYNDLISDGKADEAAFNIVVAGIGDVSGLLDELAAEEIKNAPHMHDSEVLRYRSAMLTSIAVMGYILSPLPLILLAIFGSRHSGAIGVPLLFIMIAISTGLIVFNSLTKPRYNQGSDTMVEDFRKWQSDTQSRKALRRAISAALWSITVMLYFIISFSVVGVWHLTWIIFLMAVAAEALINIFFTLKK